MGVQESLNAIYSELVNRWIRLNGTANPNTNSSLDGTPIGTFYAQTGVDPVVIYSKNRLGANGWDEYLVGTTIGKTIYADAGYTGDVINGSEQNPYKTVQSAVDAAAAMSPSEVDPVQIMLKGYFEISTEIRIHNDGIHLSADGYAEIYNTTSGGCEILYTNATDASFNAFKAGGYADYSLLVNQGDHGPYYNTVDGVNCEDIWCYGVKGDYSPSETMFLNSGLVFSKGRCQIKARNTGFISIDKSLVGTNVLTNVRNIQLRFSHLIGSSTTISFNDADPNGKPAEAYGEGYFNAQSCIVSKMIISGSVYPTLRSCGIIGYPNSFDISGMTGYAYLSDCSLQGGILANGVANFEAWGTSIYGYGVAANHTFNGQSSFNFYNCIIQGDITLAAGNVAASSLKSTTVYGTITDPSGAITYLDKTLETPNGGRAVLFQNNSGSTIAKGSIVKHSTASNDSIVLTALSDSAPCGVANADILNGKWGWVVINGPVEVLVDNAGATSRGDWIGTSTATVGRGTAQTSPPTSHSQFREIGRAMRARTGAGLVLCNVQLLALSEHFPPLVGKIVYVDKNYTGSLETGNADAPFKTIQAAINYAEASLNPSSTNRVAIYVTGVYNEEVRIHKSCVDLIGYGSAGIENSAQQNKTDNFVATGGVSEYFALSGGRSFIWNSQTVTIAGIVWTRVNNFSGSGPASKHYIVIHPDDGSGITRVQLGDGVNGALAPVGAAVTITYRKYLPSIVMSNGTNASINTFHASDVYSDLVYNPGDPVPGDNRIENFEIWGLEFLGVKGDASPSTTNFAQDPYLRNVWDSQGAFGTNWYGGSNWYFRNINYVECIMADASMPVGRILTFINATGIAFQNCWSWYTWNEYVSGDPNGEPSYGYGWGHYLTDCRTGITSIIGPIDYYPYRGNVGDLYLDSTGDGWYYSYLEDVNLWGTITITSRAGGDFIGCKLSGITLLGGGPNIPVNITNSEFTHFYPVVDTANRMVFTGRDAPYVTTRLVDAAYTGTYSNGSDYYPFTTAALARASSATAKLVSKDFIANTDVDTGTETVDSFPDTVGSSAVWTVKISKGANIQILLASAVWDAATDVISSIGLSTQSNIGVIDVTLAVSLAANVVSLTATATSDNWVVQVVERTIYA